MNIFLKSAFSDVIVKVDVTGLQTGMGDIKHGFHVHATGIKNMTDDVAGSKNKFFYNKCWFNFLNSKLIWYWNPILK